MVAAFSSAAGRVASDLEDRAAQGLLEEAGPMVGQLETMAQELLRLADSLPGAQARITSEDSGCQIFLHVARTRGGAK